MQFYFLKKINSVGWRKRRRLPTWNQVRSLDFFLTAIHIILNSLSLSHLFSELLPHLHHLWWRLILALILACGSWSFIIIIIILGFFWFVFFPAARAQDLGDELCGRSMALKSAFLGCESIDGRDSSHSCAISMSTSSAKVFFLSLSPSLGCSRPFFPPCSAFQAESTLWLCFQSSVLSLLHVLCLCLCLSLAPYSRFNGEEQEGLGFMTLNLKTCLYLLVGLVYQGKDIVFRFIVEYSSLRDFGPLGSRSIFIWGFLKDDILACVETWD